MLLAFVAWQPLLLSSLLLVVAGLCCMITSLYFRVLYYYLLLAFVAWQPLLLSSLLLVVAGLCCMITSLYFRVLYYYLIPFCLLLFFSISLISVYRLVLRIVGLGSLIGCKSLSPSLALPTSYKIIIIYCWPLLHDNLYLKFIFNFFLIGNDINKWKKQHINKKCLTSNCLVEFRGSGLLVLNYF